jgi:hypothetical protein
MSPKGENCPDLVFYDGVCLCAEYKYRPMACFDHDVPFDVCVVGLSTLGIEPDDYTAIREREKVIAEKINNLKNFKNNS